MFLRVICVALFFLPAFRGMSQADSSLTESVVLKEILIQNYGPGGGTLQHRQGNVQKSTEKILESISGVSLIKRGNFAMEPALRGLNAGQINVTIDGMAIFGACTDRMDPISSYIEPNNLKSIEINHGGNEEYNGNSIGGGFDFKLKQPRVNALKKWSGMAGLGYQTNGNALQTLASVNYSAERLAVLINGIFKQSGNYTAGGGREIRFSQYNKWNGGIGIKYTLKEKSYLLTNYLQDEGYDIGYPALTMDVKYAKAKIGSAAYIFHSSVGALRHFEGKIYFNTINHAMDDTKRPKEEVFMHMDMPGTSVTAGAIADGRWMINNHELHSKIDLYQNRLHAEMTMYPETGAPMFMLTLPDAQRKVASFQFSDKMKAGKNFSMTAGAGGNAVFSDIYSDEGAKMVSGIFAGDLKKQTWLWNAFLQPQVGLSEHFSVFANVAFNSRAATLQELYGFYLFNRPDGYDYLGNPGLRNETSLNLVSGLIYNHKKLKADGQVFHYGIKNYITGLKKDGFSVMTHGAQGVKQYSNIPSARLWGFETNLNYRVLPGLSLDSKNSFTQGTDADGDALPLIPPFKTVNRIGYHFSGNYVMLEGAFSAPQQRVDFEKYGESKTPSYFVMNVSAGRDFKWNGKRVSVNIGVENAFDRRYYAHLDILKVPQMGRNFTMQVSVNF